MHVAHVFIAHEMRTAHADMNVNMNRVKRSVTESGLHKGAKNRQ